MSLFSWLRNSPIYVRYTNGSTWVSKNTAKYQALNYLKIYQTNYAVNACINIRADYLAKFKWGIKELDGTVNYDDPLLDILKSPNPYQTSTKDFIKQAEVLKSSIGYVYQKTFGTSNPVLYNLNPSNIDFNQNNDPLLIWKNEDVKKLSKQSFSYDDNGTKKTFYFKDVMPFYSTANGLTCDENTMYTSPSKIDAIIKSISNSDLSLDGENVTLQTVGREGIFGKETKTANSDWKIAGANSLKKKEVEDIDRKLNNKNILKNQQLRTFKPDIPIEHLDMSLKIKDHSINDLLNKHESIVARSFGVPNEIYQAYKQGATFENQTSAEVKFIDYLQASEINDYAQTWTKTFGDVNRPYVGTANHLRSLQKEEDKKADKALKISQTLFNLQRSGVEDGMQFLSDLGIDLNE